MKLLAKLLISVSLLAYLIWRTDFEAVLERLNTADPLLLLCATGLMFLLVFPQTFRWVSVLSKSGAILKFRPAFVTTLIGWFFNQVLPSSVGGDAFRAWYAHRFGCRLSLAAQSVIFDRIAALLAVMFILVISSPWLSFFFPQARRSSVSWLSPRPSCSVSPSC